MEIEDWLKAASADAERRGLGALTPLLESLARSTASLREFDRAVREADAASLPGPAAAVRGAAGRER
jgi:hypothetical protein